MKFKRFYVIGVLAFFAMIPNCNSQGVYKVPPKFHTAVNAMLRQNIRSIEQSSNADAAAAHCKLWPLLLLTESTPGSTSQEEAVDGVYILVPPIDPRVEFVCLVSDSLIILERKDLRSDFNVISNFLKRYETDKDTTQWLTFFERILEIMTGRKRELIFPNNGEIKVKKKLFKEETNNDRLFHLAISIDGLISLSDMGRKDHQTIFRE